MVWFDDGSVRKDGEKDQLLYILYTTWE